jgi:hypothetical protein
MGKAQPQEISGNAFRNNNLERFCETSVTLFGYFRGGSKNEEILRKKRQVRNSLQSERFVAESVQSPYWAAVFWFGW